MQYHTPVLLNEVIDYLQVKSGNRYIDCNLGDAGHTLEILSRGGKILGIEIDPKSIERAKNRIKEKGFAANFQAVQGNFKDIHTLVTPEFSNVHGILYDLGFSSTQLEDSELGLSFQEEMPLDMRMDPKLKVKAADLINVLPEKELQRLFSEYGGERYSKKFAQRIVKARNLKKLKTTKDLVDLIVFTAPPGYEHGRIHPATRVFQALRIAVNSELQNLEESLPRAADLLLPGARMVVITFHSLEDRPVKQFGCRSRLALKTLTKKPIMASNEEMQVNPRARSAKMRVFEKI